MSYGTYTTTESTTVTVTQARYVAVKVATDLKRMQRFYRAPSDEQIDAYEKELVVLLKGNYLDKVTYGFKQQGAWRVALRYEARYGGILTADDDPGRIRPGINVDNCAFSSFLMGNHKWHSLPPAEKKRIYNEAGVGFERVAGKEPCGNWQYDHRAYSAGGCGVVRSAVY